MRAVRVSSRLEPVRLSMPVNWSLPPNPLDSPAPRSTVCPNPIPFRSL
jgi:hypothetical protein